MSGYRLFDDFAARYDLHTPPELYRGEHQMVSNELAALPAGARVLDIGCGTGALVQHLRGAGFEAHGIDIAPAMVEEAGKRLGPGVARVGRLQDLDETEAEDAIVSLAFPFNYCASVEEAAASLRRFFCALKPGGLLLLQVAHAANAPRRLIEEWVDGPGGSRDVQFLCRFVGEPGPDPTVRAQYVYSCRSLNELLFEEHLLRVADANLVAALLVAAGFSEVRLYNSHRREPFDAGFDPFLRARRAA